MSVFISITWLHQNHERFAASVRQALFRKMICSSCIRIVLSFTSNDVQLVVNYDASAHRQNKRFFFLPSLSRSEIAISHFWQLLKFATLYNCKISKKNETQTKKKSCPFILLWSKNVLIINSINPFCSFQLYDVSNPIYDELLKKNEKLSNSYNK